MLKLRAVSVLAAIFLLHSSFFAQMACAAEERHLDGAIDIEKLALSMELKTFSNGEKSAKKNSLVRQLLEDAGWPPNNEGVFTLRLDNSVLAFDDNAALGHFYIIPLTRSIIPGKKPRPATTGSYLVVHEDLNAANHIKMSGFGYIGRGSHTSGARYGILPFNRDFIRLLTSGENISYIFTFTDAAPNVTMEKRRNYELYLKCRFTNKDHDYIRLQENIKISSAESTNSRQIMEYLLCVDVVGALFYDTQTERVIREWSIDPS